MEQKEQYTVEKQPNLNQSVQAGTTDTSVTKADAAAIMVSSLAMMRRAGWKVETRQDNTKHAAYIVMPGTFWQVGENGLELAEA